MALTASNASEKASFAPWDEEPTPKTVVIRNTFIEVCAKAKESKQKRHTMPAAVGRQTEDTPAEKSAEKPDAIEHIQHLSTCVDDSTEASDGDHEVAFASDGDKDLEEAKIPPLVCPGVPQADRRQPERLLLSTCSVPSPQAATFVPLVRTPLRAPGAGRSPLSSKAKAWTPSSASGSTQNRPEAIPEVPNAFHMQTFQEELQSVLEEVKTTVMFSGCCQDATIRWEGPLHMPICRMTVTQQAEQWCLMERLKTTAKEAMLSATSKSAKVFLIGCKQMPFTARPQGFCATLSEMEDEAEACWHMYNMGCCKRQNACRWKHPQTSVAFNFDIVVAQTYVPYIPPSR